MNLRPPHVIRYMDFQPIQEIKPKPKIDLEFIIDEVISRVAIYGTLAMVAWKILGK